MPRLILIVAVLAFMIPFVLFAAIYKQSRTNEAHAADAIVVLGAAQFNGVPSQVFQARLDTALDLYRQGYAPLIVVTGGRIYGDQYTEAESGRNYLVDRGVPADAILMENVSHNTAASFVGVQKLLKPRGAQSLLIVSDGFHLYRSKMLARAAGFDAYGYASDHSPIRQGSATELRYMVRETFGVLAWKLHIKR
ncbi:MAG TPA: YdcF family protein [Thermomicrobiales bacterium]|nr:YdcF family protein [Thermomicrobiales bacterium]